ncbi:MAG: hypothetical protein R3B48_06810 [Kofleriaceae bacterium]
MIPEVEAVLALSRAPHQGGDPFKAAEYRALFQLAQDASPPSLDALVEALAPGLAVEDPFHAACVALACGTFVERGASPGVVGAAIAARLFSELASPAPAQAAGQYLCLATMAHLCRDLGLRQAVRRDHGVPECLELVQKHVPNAWFVQRVLELVDELPLLVLAPEAARGYEVRADAVASNFHLFTLLQGALIGDPAQGWLVAEPEDPEILGLATGERPHVERRSASQRFHYHDGHALTSELTLRPDLSGTLWGEASPASIPRVGDRAVVLIGPCVFGGRGWDSNFFANIHDALRSRAAVERQLSADEVTAALRAVAAAFSA